MKLTRQQRICASILGIALAALVVDRLFLGQSSPDSASAAMSYTMKASSAGVLPSRLGFDAAVEPLQEPLSRRLDIYCSQRGIAPGGVGDAFATPPSWKCGSGVAIGASASVESFVSRNRLSAVLVTDGGGSATVNGRPYSVGQLLDGFELVAVNHDSSRWHNGIETIELRLEP